MTERNVLEDLALGGRLPLSLITLWRESAEKLAALTVMAQEGATIVVKADGQRAKTAMFTVVVSGGPLREEYFHKDSPDLGSLLEESVRFYGERVWARDA